MNVSRRVLLNDPCSLLITMITLYTVSFLLLISGRQSHQFLDQGSIISPDSERQTSENWWNVIKPLQQQDSVGFAK